LGLQDVQTFQPRKDQKMWRKVKIECT
jgi:hypothetical protein